jgi:hypothetical protein
MGALHRLMWAEEKKEFITGLIYLNQNRMPLDVERQLVDTPLAQLSTEQIRPSREKLEKLMARMM